MAASLGQFECVILSLLRRGLAGAVRGHALRGSYARSSACPCHPPPSKFSN
jgi:hypothetical protein